LHGCAERRVDSQATLVTGAFSDAAR
jgi:hypothetical protein